MKRITIYDIYNSKSDDFIEYNALQPEDKLMTKQDFDISMQRFNFVIRKFTAEPREQSNEKIPVIAHEDTDNSESESVKEVEGGSTKVKVLLAYCNSTLFLKRANYEKLRNAIKSKGSEQELIIIYDEREVKIQNIGNLVNLIGSMCYVTYISMSSFISVYNHIYTPLMCSIVPPSKVKEEFSKMYIDKNKISEISWVDPLVVFMRARINDVISTEQNSMNSGLHHKYQIVKFIV